jgi:hypothetical protein
MVIPRAGVTTISLSTAREVDDLMNKAASRMKSTGILLPSDSGGSEAWKG